MSAKGLLTHNPHPTAHEVRTAMTGNICRCSNYNHYVEAVLAASSAKNAAATIGVIGLRYGTLNAGAAFRPPAPRRRSEKLPAPKVR